jgi:hypothetical protein
MGYDPHFPAHYPSKPSLDEVATMLRARTVDENGNEVGTFNDTTSPTATQAEQIIDSAYDLVLLRVGRISDDSSELQSQAKSVVMLLAARLIETVYYPEQAAQNQSAASLYGEMYEEAVRDLERAVEDDRSTSTTGGITSLSIQGATAGSDPDDPLPFAFYEQRDLDEFTP